MARAPRTTCLLRLAAGGLVATAGAGGAACGLVLGLDSSVRFGGGDAATAADSTSPDSRTLLDATSDSMPGDGDTDGGPMHDALEPSPSVGSVQGWASSTITTTPDATGSLFLVAVGFTGANAGTITASQATTAMSVTLINRCGMGGGAAVTLFIFRGGTAGVPIAVTLTPGDGGGVASMLVVEVEDAPVVMAPALGCTLLPDSADDFTTALAAPTGDFFALGVFTATGEATATFAGSSQWQSVGSDASGFALSTNAVWMASRSAPSESQLQAVWNVPSQVAGDGYAAALFLLPFQ